MEINKDNIIHFKAKHNNEYHYYICEQCGKRVDKKMSSIKYTFKEHHSFLCHQCNLINTFQKKYGVDNISQLSEIKKKKECTTMNNYGAKNPQQSKYIRHKTQQTNIKKYGVDNPSKSDKVKIKTKETCFERYGGKAPLCNKNILEKSIQTCLEKYGVENPGFLGNKVTYYYDNTIFDSSWEISFYIFHKDHNLNIIRNRHEFFILDTGYRYFPDFKDDDGFIEIKGDHLLKRDEWKYKLKCCKEHNVRLLYRKEIEPYLKYIKEKYGKNYLRQFRKQKTADFLSAVKV